MQIARLLGRLVPAAFRERLAIAGLSGVTALSAGFLYTVEGEVNHAYPDLGGVQTVCMGSTVFNPKQGYYTKEECLDLLVRDTELHMSTVLSVAPPDAPESVVAAMTSVSYNVGQRGFLVSPMRPLLEQGRYREACDAITAPHRTSKGVAMGYRATVNLKPVRGLENRRAKERELCLAGLQE